MLSDLEVLQNAERSLMDETEPFDFGEWSTCTCGHIYHSATGGYGGNLEVQRYEDDVYSSVMQKVTKVLELTVYGEDYAHAISEYTKKVSGLKDNSKYEYGFPYSEVTREHSLKVVREAIEKIREMDLIKIRDAHNYEVVHASQSH